MAMKHAKMVNPAEAGISSIAGQGLQVDPGLRRDERTVGLFGCRSNKTPPFVEDPDRFE
jgi:hypothetical protein